MWNSPVNSLPTLAQRVIVETAAGQMLFARRIVHPDNPQQYRWLDDQSIPLRSPVVMWKTVVASSETTQ